MPFYLTKYNYLLNTRKEHLITPKVSLNVLCNIVKFDKYLCKKWEKSYSLDSFFHWQAKITEIGLKRSEFQ